MILQAAQDVLVEKGYHDMSMDEIAARVGIAKGTVYLHFPSKEDMVIALFVRDVQLLAQRIKAVVSEQATPKAKLASILRFVYGELFEKKMQTLHVIYNSAELKKLFEDRRMTGCMQESWQKLTETIGVLLDEGKAAGEFDQTLPTPVMQHVFFGLISPKSYERLINEEHMTPDDLVQYASRIYFKGIAAGNTVLKEE